MIRKKVKVAVLAVQGDFIEHEIMLRKLGIDVIKLRKQEDLLDKFDALVLPGGESTVQEKLLKELGMLTQLRQLILNGMPVLATCAGLVLLAETIEAEERENFHLLPVTVRRNAYGRQLGSFFFKGKISGIEGDEFPMRFIRAPYITAVRDDVQVLARDKEEHIVGVNYKKMLALAFHPELTEDTRIHRLFLQMIE